MAGLFSQIHLRHRAGRGAEAHEGVSPPFLHRAVKRGQFDQQTELLRHVLPRPFNWHKRRTIDFPLARRPLRFAAIGMAVKVFNTLSRSVEELVPLDPAGKKVGMYCCGPTVYDFAHIGNWRTFVFADLVRRYLTFRGYDLNHVLNITDVED